MCSELVTALGPLVGAILGGAITYFATKRLVKMNIGRDRQKRLEDRMLDMLKYVKKAHLCLDNIHSSELDTEEKKERAWRDIMDQLYNFEEANAIAIVYGNKKLINLMTELNDIFLRAWKERQKTPNDLSSVIHSPEAEELLNKFDEFFDEIRKILGASPIFSR